MAKLVSKQSSKKDARVEEVREWLLEARGQGNTIKLKDIMDRYGISKPIAISTRKSAEALIAADGATGGPVAVTAQVVAAPTNVSGPQAIALGLDMTRELQASASRLRELSNEMRDQLRHATYFVLGCPEGHEYPGLCSRCGAEEVAKITVRNQPRLLQIGYLDIAKLVEAAAKTEVAMKGVVDSYDSVLTRFYSYEALAKFISDVRTAIQNVCPENQKALSAEIRRLQLLAGGIHGIG